LRSFGGGIPPLYIITYERRIFMLLCDRCVRGIKLSGEKYFISGSPIEDTTDVCEWCEMTDTDLYIVRPLHGSYADDE